MIFTHTPCSLAMRDRVALCPHTSDPSQIRVRLRDVRRGPHFLTPNSWTRCVLKSELKFRIV